MDIKFDMAALIQDLGRIASKTPEKDMERLSGKLLGMMAEFKRLYESSHMRGFRKKFDSGTETKEDLDRFHLESVELLKLADGISHVRNELRKLEKDMDGTF